MIHLRRPRLRWAALTAASAASLVVVTLAAVFAGVVDLPWTPDEAYPVAVFGLTLPLLGAVVLRQAPGQPVGRLLLLSGAASAVALAAFAYAQYGVVQHPGELPVALAVGWLSSWVWVLGVPLLLTLGPLVYPDGRLPGRPWRWALGPAVAGPAALGLTNALRPGPLSNHPVSDNPLGIRGGGPMLDVVGGIGLLLFFVALGCGLGALVVRWRRSAGQDRAAVGWLLAAVAPIALVALAPAEGSAAIAAGLVAVLAVPLLPFAVAVGVLRHRLYGVEPVIGRSLVWWSVTTALLAVYAASAALLDAALRGRSGAAVALASTALVAVLSAPLRDRAQAAADRLLFGERGNPHDAVIRIGRRVGDVTDAAAVLGETARAVAEALRAPYAAVHLPGDVQHPSAAHGHLVEPVHEVALAVHGDTVGTLVVSVRPGEQAYGRRERRLLAELRPPVAAAAHAALLRRALEASRERLARSLEEERRRLRRDLHDGLGPALTGIAFTADAARNIVGSDPAQAGALLEQVSGEARACIDEVRRIAHDLRPPALDDLGLPGALESYATRLRGEGGPAMLLHCTPLPSLPAVVEVAAYRIGVEALTNAVRHAQAGSCRISLELHDERDRRVLRVTVEDDGIGLPAQRRPGVGLAAMQERTAEVGGRFAVRPRAGGGTSVTADLPLTAS